MATSAVTTGSTVAAYFATEIAAHNAVERLKAAGFSSAHLGYAGRKPGEVSGSTATSEQATTSSKGEGAWDKIKGFFEGGDVEPYADESNRDKSTSHEITAVDDYNSTDVHGSFTGLSIPESTSRYFSHHLGKNEEGAVVTVQAGTRVEEAEQILSTAGGDLGSGAAEYDYGSSDTNVEDISESQRIQLLGEVLRVHKNRVSSGEVHIRKEVITEQQTIQVPVSHEELVVERIAGDGLTPVAGTIGETEIRIPLSQEQAYVDKQTVVREEVSIGKREVEEVQNVGGSVQHEELEINEQRTTQNQ